MNCEPNIMNQKISDQEIKHSIFKKVELLHEAEEMKHKPTREIT